MILPEFRLILECCKGEASVEDAVFMKMTELSDSLYNPTYNIIVDFREFVTFLDSKVKEKTIDFYNFLKGLNINSKIAFLTAEPHQVVISLILKELNINSELIKIEVFSTVEAAGRYLGFSDENFALINTKIKELNKNTA